MVHQLEKIKALILFLPMQKYQLYSIYRMFILYIVDDTRVILTEIPGVEGSDYINANYIDVSLLNEPFII